MLVHGRIASSSVNGPGTRGVLWFQGCALACHGCWNQDSWDFDTTRYVPHQEIIDWILGLSDIEGITFSGGEPMMQAQYLYLIMAKVREKRPDLSFAMYTGYTLKELQEGKYRWKRESDGEWQQGTPELWNEIKSYLDFAVMGRYNEAKQTKDKPLCGSSNQTVEFFTSRYSEADLKPQEFEVQIDNETGLVQITGFPTGIDQDLDRDLFGKRAVSSVSSPLKRGENPDDAELVHV